ncbi:hypothetical protein DFH09DRAFT_1315015 [Mycena vulgaris]|nr:hypothetical protein DFH09DRAFT_1315015 [Mycena vulgaris]
MTSFTPLAAALLRNSNTLTSDPMPPNLGRLDSDTTHVSDSEPEREARRRARHNSHSSTASSAPNSPAPQRMPLSAVSNTLPVAEPAERPALDCRLSAVEGELAEIKVGLAALRSQIEPPQASRVARRLPLHSQNVRVSCATGQWVPTPLWVGLMSPESIAVL